MINEWMNVWICDAFDYTWGRKGFPHSRRFIPCKFLQQYWINNFSASRRFIIIKTKIYLSCSISNFKVINTSSSSKSYYLYFWILINAIEAKRLISMRLRPNAMKPRSRLRPDNLASRLSRPRGLNIPEEHRNEYNLKKKKRKKEREN